MLGKRCPSPVWLPSVGDRGLARRVDRVWPDPGCGSLWDEQMGTTDAIALSPVAPRPNLSIICILVHPQWLDTFDAVGQVWTTDLTADDSRALCLPSLLGEGLRERVVTQEAHRLPRCSYLRGELLGRPMSFLGEWREALFVRLMLPAILMSSSPASGSLLPVGEGLWEGS